MKESRIIFVAVSIGEVETVGIAITSIAIIITINDIDWWTKEFGPNNPNKLKRPFWFFPTLGPILRIEALAVEFGHLQQIGQAAIILLNAISIFQFIFDPFDETEPFHLASALGYTRTTLHILLNE